MKDGSVKITLVTRELAPQQMAELFLSLNKEIMTIDLPEEQEEVKSPSQRLRAVLYRLWEQTHKDKFETFELFYRHRMEQLCTHFKDQLQ